MNTKQDNKLPIAKAGIQKIKPHMVSSSLITKKDQNIVLDSNENSFGPSQKAIDAAKNAANSLERYVENPASILVPELSKTYDLESALVSGV